MRRRNAAVLVAGLASVLAACGPSEYPVTCPGEGDYEFADHIVDAPGSVDAPSAVNDPENAVNGVVDGRPDSGSLDVFSRGLSTEPPNHYLVLEWSGRIVVDGPGADVVVFENAFATQGGTFMDPAVVEVSDDGEGWQAFPHDYTAPDETTYSRDPALWEGFAGVTPVRWRSSTCSSPFDTDAGGDMFDLADIGRQSFRFLRITSAAALENPDTGSTYPREAIADGFDLDGVFARSTQMR